MVPADTKCSPVFTWNALNNTPSTRMRSTIQGIILVIIVV